MPQQNKAGYPDNPSLEAAVLVAEVILARLCQELDEIRDLIADLARLKGRVANR